MPVVLRECKEASPVGVRFAEVEVGLVRREVLVAQQLHKEETTSVAELLVVPHRLSIYACPQISQTCQFEHQQLKQTVAAAASSAQEDSGPQKGRQPVQLTRALTCQANLPPVDHHGPFAAHAQVQQVGYEQLFHERRGSKARACCGTRCLFEGDHHAVAMKESIAGVSYPFQ